MKADELEQLIYLQTVKSSQSMKVKSSSMKENSTIDFYVKVTRPFLLGFISFTNRKIFFLVDFNRRSAIAADVWVKYIYICT